jgi:hypothetical protein
VPEVPLAFKRLKKAPTPTEYMASLAWRGRGGIRAKATERG